MLRLQPIKIHKNSKITASSLRNEKLVKMLIDRNFDSSTIRNLLAFNQIHPDAVTYIINSKEEQDGVMKPRFDNFDIDFLVDAFMLDKDLTFKLLEEKQLKLLCNEKIEERFRNGANDLDEVVRLFNEPDFQELYNAKVKIGDKLTPAYSCEKILNILGEVYDEALSKLKTKDGYNLLNGYEIYASNETGCLSKGFLQKLIKRKSPVLKILNKYNFDFCKNNVDFLESIIDVYSIPKLETNRLISYYPDKKVVLTFDKDQNITSHEVIKQDGNKYFSKAEFTNGDKINTEMDIMTHRGDDIGLDIKRTIFKDGLIESENIDPFSSKFYGLYSQGQKYRKNYTSPDGVKSEQTTIYGPAGSYQKYEIKDDEKVLCSIERKFRKLDENHTRSFLNGKQYDIEFLPKEAIIKTGNQTKTIKLNPKFYSLYKLLPGDILFNMSDLKLAEMPYSDESAYYFAENEVELCDEDKNNGFVFAHEFGHMLDYLYEIALDKELQSVYNQELESHKNSCSFLESNELEYLRDDLGEIIAESCAIFSGLENKDYKPIRLRSELLKKYFPKTMAYIWNKLNLAD